MQNAPKEMKKAQYEKEKFILDFAIVILYLTNVGKIFELN
jgi:hypothetical protein